MSDGEAMSGTHDCGGDAAAYVLGALGPAEAHEFRRHLEECAVCRDEVAALTGVVDALPMGAPQHPAPQRLRRRVMRAVRAEPPAGIRAPRRGIPAGPWRMAITAATAVLIAGLVIAGIEISGNGSSGRVVHAQVAGISGTAELRVTGGRAELIVRHLSPPPAGHVYEVWLKAPRAAPVPASVLFSVDASGSAEVGIPGTVHGISQVMVTAEPQGGSRSPTHAPVIVADLT